MAGGGECHGCVFYRLKRRREVSPTIRKRTDRGGRSRSPSARRRFERQLSPPRKRCDRCALLNGLSIEVGSAHMHTMYALTKAAERIYFGVAQHASSAYTGVKRNAMRLFCL